ncbi:MAG: OPT/YSL family transporter [Phycisphaeraceae bacterium]|nr:OPT/YSL family transporter [Phycisphaeraceae bacterium]
MSRQPVETSDMIDEQDMLRGGKPPPLPDNATPEEKDAHWYKYVYQGDRMPQLTWRAVIMGGFLGMIMSAANLYTTLSIGWAFGIAITACVLSFVIWNFVRFTSGGNISQMSILENACMASTASAAGYSTGSTIATMFGALVLLKDPPAGLQGEALRKWQENLHTWDVTPVWVVVVFTLCTGLMGVFLAIPMKRQQINHEQLPFPTGTAAAETLKSLYSESKDAVGKAYVLIAGLAAGLLIGFLRVGDDVLGAVGFLRRLFEKIWFLRIPTDVQFNFLDRAYPGARHANGFAFEPSALLIAAGMIVGMRISLSLVLSSLFLYAVVGPELARMDARHMERGAIVVQEAALVAAKGQATPEAAATAAVEAVAAAAAELKIDPAPIRTAAEQSVEDAIAAAGATTKPAAERAENVGKAIGAAAAPLAATAYSNRDAIAAADAEKSKVLAAGASEAEAKTAWETEFDRKRYKPNLIWNWGGGTITITRWSLWGGTAVMVFASLMSVALQWRTIARAFMGVKRAAGGSTASHAEIEVPGSWMIYGMVPITIAMVWLQIQAFNVSWYAGLIAVAMSFVLSLVASRATGETDTTPVGAMGKVMQLLFAALAPQNISANLASAGIAANSASSSADLLTDLKTGYLLGANPRKQFLAQFYGVFFGTIAIVPIWYLMVPTRAKLESFALPATRVWETVARGLVKGVGELPASAVWSLFIGAGVGIVLPLIEKFLPPKARRFMPSATGIGLAWVLPFQNALAFFIGAVIIMVWNLLHRRSADKYNVGLASGLIAGESLMAAALAITATLVGIFGL